MSIKKTSGISTSRFFMWRAVFAMAHADGVVTPQEISFLTESTQSLPFSDAQRQMLSRDIAEEQDAAVMFAQVTDAADREEFFVLARVLCWSDGDYDEQERIVMDVLQDISAKQEAQAFLERSKATVQEIKLNKDQWVNKHDTQEKPMFEWFGKFLKSA